MTMNQVFYDKRALWLPWFTTRVVIFFFYMANISFLLYILGNFQNFSDTTQFFLFDMMTILFYSFFCTAVLNVILNSVFSVRGRKTGFFYYLRYFLMVTFTGILYFAINFIFKFIETVH